MSVPENPSESQAASLASALIGRIGPLADAAANAKQGIAADRAGSAGTGEANELIDAVASRVDELEADCRRLMKILGGFEAAAAETPAATAETAPAVEQAPAADSPAPAAEEAAPAPGPSASAVTFPAAGVAAYAGAAAAPEPETATPGPETPTPEPETVTPEPEAAMPEPEVATPEPESVVTTEPEAVVEAAGPDVEVAPEAEPTVESLEPEAEVAPTIEAPEVGAAPPEAAPETDLAAAAPPSGMPVVAPPPSGDPVVGAPPVGAPVAIEPPDAGHDVSTPEADAEVEVPPALVAEEPAAGGEEASDEPARVSEGVRLLATQMSVAGASSEDIARRLHDDFGVQDADRLIAKLFGPGGQTPG